MKIQETENYSTEELLQQMSGKIHVAHSAYYVWKWLEQARNLNSGKDIAEKNVEIMNRQRNFFKVALEGSFDLFILNLMIFFGRDDTLSMKKLLQKITISDAERGAIDDILNKHENTIRNVLKRIRDKDIAHFDINIDRTLPNKIVYKEIEDLFESVGEIFNILSRNFNQSFWIFDHIDIQMKGDMEYLFENLERGEKGRIEEIDKME